MLWKHFHFHDKFVKHQFYVAIDIQIGPKPFLESAHASVGSIQENSIRRHKNAQLQFHDRSPTMNPANHQLLPQLSLFGNNNFRNFPFLEGN